MKIYFLNFILCFIPSICMAQQVTTLAGSSAGFADGTFSTAQFSSPNGICTVGSGASIAIYIVDSENNRIRKIDAAGNVTTIAGSTFGSNDGSGTTAKFIQPKGICTDGNSLFITDWGNNRIRKIEIVTGVVSTLAGNTKGYFDATGASVMFDHPSGICYDGNGVLYTTDSGNNKIRKIVIATAQVTTIAGSTSGYIDGLGSIAQFNNPNGICIDTNDSLYITDGFNDNVRKINLATTVVTTVAGGPTQGYIDATGTAAKFRSPSGICIDSSNNLYVADANNNRIRKISPLAEVTTFAGFSSGSRDGAVDYASFYTPLGIVLDNDGIFYITDSGNSRIRKITGASLATIQNTNPIATIKLFPNPTTKQVNINYNLAKNSWIELKLFSAQGQLVFENTTNQSSGAHHEIIDLNSQVSGIYFLKINADKGIQTFKIIKN